MTVLESDEVNVGKTATLMRGHFSASKPKPGPTIYLSDWKLFLGSWEISV
jgi:hypothetical protein